MSAVISPTNSESGFVFSNQSLSPPVLFTLYAKLREDLFFTSLQRAYRKSMFYEESHLSWC